MATASLMAEQNSEKETLAKELQELVIQRRIKETREKYLKDRLMGMMKVGERIGMVAKITVQGLEIGEELLEKLAERFGSDIIRREANVKKLRELMEADPNLDKEIPRKEPSPQIRVD